MITLRAEDIPTPNAAKEITLTGDAIVRLSQSVIAWKNYVKLVASQCGEPLPVP